MMASFFKYAVLLHHPGRFQCRYRMEGNQNYSYMWSQHRKWKFSYLLLLNFRIGQHIALFPVCLCHEWKSYMLLKAAFSRDTSYILQFFLTRLLSFHSLSSSTVYSHYRYTCKTFSLCNVKTIYRSSLESWNRIISCWLFVHVVNLINFQGCPRAINSHAQQLFDFERNIHRIIQYWPTEKDAIVPHTPILFYRLTANFLFCVFSFLSTTFYTVSLPVLSKETFCNEKNTIHKCFSTNYLRAQHVSHLQMSQWHHRPPFLHTE